MEAGTNPLPLDELVSATAQGVLRALDARAAGAERVSTSELVASGFMVDIHIIAGGFPTIPSSVAQRASLSAGPSA